MYGESAPDPTGPPPAAPAVPMTRLFLVLNALIFIAMAVSSGGDFEDLCTLLRFGAKFNALIAAGEWWRLLAPIFLHIGLPHLLFNEYALWSFGREVEQLFGSPRFTAIYLLAGLFGTVASYAFSPAISAGASGSIFGIIGALAAFFLHNRRTFGELGRRQLSSLASVIAINLLLGFTIPGIDNWGHLGGLLSGFLLGLFLSPSFNYQETFQGYRLVIRHSQPRTITALTLALLALLAATLTASAITPTDPLEAQQITALCSRP
jgi:rhomboid protease GluP